MATLQTISGLFPGWQLVIFFFLLFLFLIGGGVTTFIILSRLRWPVKVQILFKNIGSFGSHEGGRDRARLVDYLDSGEQIYYWKKRKKYRVGNEKYVGKNRMAWARSQDGYYRNVGYGDVDDYLGVMGIVPVTLDMRHATGIVRKGIEARHGTKNFFEKWAVPITITMLILAIIIQAGGQWWSIREQNKSKAVDLEIAKIQKETQDLARQTLSDIANIKSGGSGFIPV